MCEIQSEIRSGPTPPAAPDPPGLDLPAVLRWLDVHAPNVIIATPTARLIAGGRSNLTYLLDDGARQVVLRRPPLGHVLATAHDMAREHRVIAALAGTGVPVPQVLALCTDPTVTGAPFYLMSFVPGLIVRGSGADGRGVDASGAGEPGLDAVGRTEVAAAMMAVLADLHEVDVAAAGLSDFGRPEGFLERQVRRWSKQLAASRSRDLPGIDRLRDRLAADIPTGSAGLAGTGSSTGSGGSAGIVHGDYRLDNLIVAPPGAADALRVRAVLDWEMATLGDPLTDLGLLLAYWDTLSGLDSSLVGTVGTAQGFPDGATLTGWYAARRDVDLSRLPWYHAFGLFKLAVILEGIHYRYQLGQTVGDDFAGLGAMVPLLIDAGLDVLDRPAS